MCEPTTIIMVAGLVISAEAQREAGQYQSAVAKQNAAIQAQAAKDALASGLVEAEGVAIKGGRATGELKAGFGASGVTVNSGSPLEAIADSALFAELDKQTVQANAARTAWGYRAAATYTLAEGQMAARAAQFSVGSTLLLGAAQSYGNYMKVKV